MKINCEPCICELESRYITNEYIIFDGVCFFFNISPKELISKRRDREICEPRQMAMMLMSENTNLSLKEIGKMFGDRDHTTVIHSKVVCRDLLGNNPIFRDTFTELKKYILK